MDNASKLNKTLIFFTFIIIVWLNAITFVKERLHLDNELSIAFKTSDAGAATQLAFALSLWLGSFISVYWIKALWNNLIPRITSWKEINYWEAMGITAFIFLLTLW